MLDFSDIIDAWKVEADLRTIIETDNVMVLAGYRIMSIIMSTISNLDIFPR